MREQNHLWIPDGTFVPSFFSCSEWVSHGECLHEIENEYATVGENNKKGANNEIHD